MADWHCYMSVWRPYVDLRKKLAEAMYVFNETESSVSNAWLLKTALDHLRMCRHLCFPVLTIREGGTSCDILCCRVSSIKELEQICVIFRSTLGEATLIAATTVTKLFFPWCNVEGREIQAHTGKMLKNTAELSPFLWLWIDFGLHGMRAGQYYVMKTIAQTFAPNAWKKISSK